jgi:hypothetical protein
MKRLLVVSPRFPPVNAAEMHRARLSLPYFSEFGWEPHVLAVGARHQPDADTDPLLLETVPPDVPVTHVGAVPLRWSRACGIGNVALRAWLPLYRAGRRLIRERRIDLVYFSTTMFMALPLGRLWKRTLGVPYVIDMQDPWVAAPAAGAGRKRALADRLHAVLEPFTMRQVDGLIAVSAAYTTTLRGRYPAIAPDACATIPFGASAADLDVARRLSWRNPFFTPGDGRVHGVSVGRGGGDMAIAAEILFRAWRHIERTRAVPADLLFVGTDYAPAGQGRRTIAPLAEASGVAAAVTESPERVPYFHGLRLLADADFLIVLGSEDAQYSPSKVYPYLLTGRPLVAILHEASPVVDLLRRAGAGVVVTFSGRASIDASAAALAAALPRVLDGGRETTVDPSLFEAFSARELTRQQCALFDAVMAHRLSASTVPCPA